MRWLRGVLPVAAGLCAIATAVHPVRAQAGPEWLLVVDEGAGRVLVVAPDGSSAPVVDGLPAFVAPGGLALHPDGQSAAVIDRGDGPEAGTILVLAPEAPPIPVASGLDEPGGVAWADDTTLVVTAGGGTVVRIDVQAGTVDEIATLPGEVAGIVAFEGFGQGGMLVPSVSGPVFLVDPETGDFGPFTDDLNGAGHPSVDAALGLCVPELASDGIRCFAFDGSPGSEFGPVTDPVATGSTSGGLVVAGAAGLAYVDGASDTITALLTDIASPTAVVSLGSDPGSWADALDASTATGGPPAAPAATDAPTTEVPTTTIIGTTPAEATVDIEVAPPTTVETDTTAVGDDRADAPVPTEDQLDVTSGGGDGPPWPAIALAVAVVTLIAGVAVALVSRHRRRSRREPVDEPGDPGVFHARRARAAAAAGVEQTFWNAHRAAEEQALWIQVAMRLARAADDRRRFDDLEARLHHLVDELARARAELRTRLASELPDPFGLSTVATTGDTQRAPSDVFFAAAPPTVDTNHVATKMVRSRLEGAAELVDRQQREVDEARRAVERATETLASRREVSPTDPAGGGERPTEPANGEAPTLRPTAGELALLVPDARLAEHHLRTRTQEIAVRQESLEQARHHALRALDAYVRTAPGQPEHGEARHRMQAALRRYEESWTAYGELRPPGPQGPRIVADRLRRALRDGTVSTEGLGTGSAGLRARLAELDQRRAELDELTNTIAGLRAALGDVGRDPDSRPPGDRAASEWTMHVHVDVDGPPHAAIGLRGPDVDVVFSMAEGRDTIGRHASSGWRLDGAGSDDDGIDLATATNQWYRDTTDACARLRAELIVSLTEAQFDDCSARLTAFARSGPGERYAPVPVDDDAARCPALWMVVRSVFVPVTTYGTAWFAGSGHLSDRPWSRRSVIDDALSIFEPRLLGTSPAPYGWDEAG